MLGENEAICQETNESRYKGLREKIIEGVRLLQTKIYGKHQKPLRMWHPKDGCDIERLGHFTQVHSTLSVKAPSQQYVPKYGLGKFIGTFVA